MRTKTLMVDVSNGASVYDVALALWGLKGLPLVLDSSVTPGDVEVSALCISINPSDRPDGACPTVEA